MVNKDIMVHINDTVDILKVIGSRVKAVAH